MDPPTHMTPFRGELPERIYKMVRLGIDLSLPCPVPRILRKCNFHSDIVNFFLSLISGPSFINEFCHFLLLFVVFFSSPVAP